MAKKFEVFRKGYDGDARDINKYTTAVDRLVEKLPSGDVYEWTRRGSGLWHPVNSKPALKDELLSRKLPVGDAFWARREGGNIFVLRAIQVVTIPAYPDPNGLAGITDVWDRAWTAFRALGDDYEFVYMGAFVCRRIDGSSTWSQHAFHQAFDFRIRRKSQPDSSIDTAATTKVVNAIKPYAAESIWQSAGHYFHAHETGKPKQFGTPACA